MQKSRVLLIQAIVAVGFTVAACSSDSAESGISRAEFLRRAKEVCTSARDDLVQATADADLRPGDAAAAEAFLTEQFVPRLQQELKELRAIGYPERDQDELRSIYDQLSSVLSDLKSRPEGFVASETDPFSRVSARFERYGLKQCSRTPVAD